MKTKLVISILFPMLALAQTPNITLNINEPKFKTELEPQINVAKLEKREQNLPQLGTEQAEQIQITLEQLKQNPALTHELLSRAIYARNPEMI